MTTHHDAPVFSGALPNIYHHALTFDHLRQFPTFTALPPVDSICIAGPSSYRYIRQDDDLWGRLHTGRLTSGYLSAALGLFEPAAAKRLKLNKSRISHGPLLNAYRHLSQQPYHPSVNGNITEESAAVHNAQITTAFNRSVPSSTSSVFAEGSTIDRKIGIADSGNVPASDPNKNNRRRKKKKTGTAQQHRPAAAGAGGSLAAATSTSFFISEELKLKKARALGSQGLDAVRCAWGTAQESTTLHVLASTGVFQKSEIIEAGLFTMEESVLPKNWGFRPGELPPIGSSPDALAQHQIDPGGVLPRYVQSSVLSNKDGIITGEAVVLSEAALLSRLTLEDTQDSPKLGIDGIEELDRVLEVVEVKNTCPFDYSQQKQGGGKRKKRKFVVCDRGPRSQFDVLWVPQLQLHMLCSQTSSSLLVSRSATRGLRVFRVAADPEFQRLMLCVLRRLYTEHVIPQNVPKKDVFEHMPEHGELLKRIRGGVAKAEVVAEVSGEEASAVLSDLSSGNSGNATKIDCRFFLD
ncbi:hypothetical protein NADE_002180 [Nannochloris sp. 'desiccata']|nr:hypothetical protein KSW81_003121 [Chlorella desiccata (nom. nud.)]KAH7624960.1 hypothetical protein NADE_002180 [Chlorella desiccata (nom. nud.)]